MKNMRRKSRSCRGRGASGEEKEEDEAKKVERKKKRRRKMWKEDKTASSSFECKRGIFRRTTFSSATKLDTRTSYNHL
jgi:hypothetical protein